MELRLIIAKVFWVYDIELLDKNLDWLRECEDYAFWIKPKLRAKVTKRAGIATPEVPGLS